MEEKEQHSATFSNTRHFDLTSFVRAQDKMIATNTNAYSSIHSSTYDRLWGRFFEKYTTEEIVDIINNGSLLEQQRLSRYFFDTDGYYKRLVTHYATLLKYMGLLIANPSAGKTLSTPHIQKRYFSAMDFVESMKLPTWLTDCAMRALIDGCYYGVRIDTDRNSFAVLDLPAQYCRSRFKDLSGNDLIEFDLSYFNTISVLGEREAALEAFPKIISKAYKKFAKGNFQSSWFIIPSDIGICLPLLDGKPLFLTTIPAILSYNEAVKNRQEKEAEDIRKIIVQQIPHLSDGRLVFEPDEAEEIHAGTVGMLKGNKNISVLTTYADVEAITSRSTDDDSNALLTRAEQNIFAQAGVSGEIFATKSSAALEASLNNDLAIMMYFANKASAILTNIINEKWSNSNVSFKYSIIDASYYNKTEFLTNAFKLVGSGYSVLLPALAQGLSQRDLINVKDLENDVLKLSDRLKPLSTAYTQSQKDNTEVDEGGRPALKESQKTEETIKVQQSKEQAEGGS